jgi:hypothetical protein
MKQVLIITTELNSSWLKRLLQSLQAYEVTLISPSGLEAALLGRINAVVLDYDNLNNWKALIDFLHKYKSDLLILAVTVSPTWQEARTLFRYGITDYLPKEIDNQQVIAALADC